VVCSCTMTVVARVVLLLLLGALFYYISSNILDYEKTGMDVIMRVQDMRSPALDIIMRIGTVFGFEFFFVLVPLLAWWGDSKYQRLGASLFTLLLVVLFCVSVLKATFIRPRPFVMNSNIADPNHPDKIEFSYPSGHAWASMSFFFIAKSMQGIIYWIGAVVVSAFTLFSRVYFGVHYPHDLAAGVTCGVALLLLFSFAEGFLDSLFSESQITDEKSHNKRHFLNMTKFFNVPNAAAILLLVVSSVISYTMDEAIKAKQQGILFVPFCLLGVILCRPFIPPMRCEHEVPANTIGSGCSYHLFSLFYL